MSNTGDRGTGAAAAGSSHSVNVLTRPPTTIVRVIWGTEEGRLRTEAMGKGGDNFCSTRTQPYTVKHANQRFLFMPENTERLAKTAALTRDATPACVVICDEAALLMLCDKFLWLDQTGVKSIALGFKPEETLVYSKYITSCPAGTSKEDICQFVLQGPAALDEEKVCEPDPEVKTEDGNEAKDKNQCAVM